MIVLCATVIAGFEIGGLPAVDILGAGVAPVVVVVGGGVAPAVVVVGGGVALAVVIVGPAAVVDDRDTTGIRAGASPAPAGPDPSRANAVLAGGLAARTEPEAARPALPGDEDR